MRENSRVFRVSVERERLFSISLATVIFFHKESSQFGAVLMLGLDKALCASIDSLHHYDFSFYFKNQKHEQ